MAFAGIESDLKRMIDVSTSGLLLKLKDNKIINGEQYNLVKVSAKFRVPLAIFVLYLVYFWATVTNNASPYATGPLS